MQTAVEWLVDQLTNVDRPNYTNKRILAISKNSLQEKRIYELVEQAKEMEKQQIIDAYATGSNDRLKSVINDYYNETYGSKGSETTSSQTISEKWKEYQDWLNEIPEISDEEIIKGAEEWYEIEGAYKPSMIAIKTWLNACKWYRGQLKQKL